MVNGVTHFALIFKLVEMPRVCVCAGRGGGGYSDIFIHAYMYGLEHFWVQILKFKSLGGFKISNIYLGMP